MQFAWQRAVLALVCVFQLGAAGKSYATTIATFADPSTGAPPLFDIDLKSRTIAGSWANPNLTLQTIGGSFSNARFSMPILSFNPSFETAPGFIEFRESNSNLLLRIDFSSAHLTNPLGFGSTEFLSLNEVVFSGPVVNPPGIVDGTESFSFAFANQTPTDLGYTATASFTSSGQLVPEPSTLAALGALALMRGRRLRPRLALGAG